MVQPTRRTPPGLYDQDLSEADADQMEQILAHRLGIPTRPAGDLPQGNLSKFAKPLKPGPRLKRELPPEVREANRRRLRGRACDCERCRGDT